MKLRRFSQLGWHGCMDLVAAAAGHHVVRVELGEPPKPFELCARCTPHSLCTEHKVATWKHYDAHFGTDSEPRIRDSADEATEPCEICKELFPPEKLDCEPYGRICDPCYWSLHNL